MVRQCNGGQISVEGERRGSRPVDWIKRLGYLLLACLVFPAYTHKGSLEFSSKAPRDTHSCTRTVAQLSGVMSSTAGSHNTIASPKDNNFLGLTTNMTKPDLLKSDRLHPGWKGALILSINVDRALINLVPQ